ncbi:hypothetical protein EON65_02690 [archaeon]|nr:MAG: hypothetical protein EON65_02690 [archaeon]
MSSCITVSCQSVVTNDTAFYSITVSHKSEPLVKTTYDSSKGHTATDRACLGTFSLYDDLVVTIKNTEKKEKVERVSIPIICLDKSKPSTLVLTFATIEVSIVFEAIQDTPYAHESEFKEEFKQPIAVPIATAVSSISTSSSTGGRTRLFLRTADVYKLLKSASAAIIHRRTTELVQIFHTVKLLVYHLLDGGKFISLVLLDISQETLSSMDMLLTSLLDQVDRNTEAAYTFLIDILLQFVGLLRQRLGDSNTILGRLVQGSIQVSRPVLRMTWRLTGPLARPLLSPVVSRLTEQWRKDGQLGPIIDEAMDTLNLILDS